MLYFRIGGAEVHLLKLCGALILFAAILGILNTSAAMWQSWKFLNAAKECLAYYSSPFSPEKQVCLDSAFKATGVYIGPQQTHLDDTQYWIVLLNPVILLVAWAAVFVFGWMVYNLGKTFIPIEEAEKPLAERARHHKR